MKDEREASAMGRFELVCEAFINGSQQQREIILSMLDEHDRETFLKGCGLYRMFTDQLFYNAVEKAVGEQVYSEFQKQAETV